MPCYLSMCDFHKVSGVDGVYIANTLEHGKLTTQITFDKGGVWEPLQPPAARS